MCLVVEQIAFQSSPPPERGCNVSACLTTELIVLFQSSPPPERGCNGWTLKHINDSRKVSILTPA